MAKILWSGSDNERIQAVGWRLEALVLRALWWLVAPMSLDRASATGRRLVRRLGPHTAKQRQVVANLRTVFPERSRTEIEALARAVWANLGAVLAELGQLEKLLAALRGPERLQIVHLNRDSEFLAGRKTVIFVTAHCANWELAAFAAQQLSGKLDVVYTPQSNPYLDRMIQDKRRALGCGFIGKVSAVRGMLKSLKRGRSVGLLVDTRVDEGPLEPFFGVPAQVTPTPAWLALKTGCDIVPVQVERVRDARFRIIFHPALHAARCDDESDEQTVSRVTRQINARVESWIRAQPGDWMCTKRRWPKELMRQRDARSPP
ncbi:MAG: lysophospholipid acyltransferase family protein [Gammaproteobacteria bacterium]|jgi:KDO2-lipid IV(A) lauroyltransferase